jgi:quercetin dioxygenase-like cupin family protein
MRPTIYCALAGGTLLLAGANPLCAQAARSAAKAPAATHAARPEEPKWGPAPAVFPAGAQMAVLAGDPHGNGEFTVRLRMPNGYRIMPHTHPTDEHITVISGNFLVGMGTSFDEKATMKLNAGGFVTAPANHAHFAMAQGTTIVQVHAMGPFALNYVNAADMPKAGGGR